MAMLSGTELDGAFALGGKPEKRAVAAQPGGRFVGVGGKVRAATIRWH